MDKKKPMREPIALSTPFTEVLASDLSDLGSPLNDRYVSGKKAGSLVWVKEQDGSYELYKSLGGEVDSGWEIAGGGVPPTPELPAIWVLDTTSTVPTTLVANTPTQLEADVANKFNAVEQEYLGNLNMLSATDLEFTASQAGDYEFQVRGVIEDSANAVSKLAVSLMDVANSSNLTGSMWTQPAAFAWGGTNEFSINCTGLLRMNANEKVSLQAVSDANATVVVKSLIVKMTKIA